MTQHNKEILLVKSGELALKGLNRSTFEAVLMKNIRHRLRPLGDFRIRNAQSTTFIEPQGEVDFDEVCDRISRVFGIAAFSRALTVQKDMADILDKVGPYLREQLEGAVTFKVEAKRSDKSFPLKSPQIAAEVGGKILEQFPHLRVDVHHPQVLVMVEIRDFGAYIHAQQQPGAGGMPVGTAGRAAVLISGGIDSPVAAYMMAKRGIELTAIHFASPPYTSERAEMKVISLLRQVGLYAGRIEMLIVPFTRIQEQIRDNCPEELFTLVMRRMMMRISCLLARQEGALALITGESVGQVASQTMQAIACTDAVTDMPVFRPLIGMDKEEIITVSRKIDTFDISIQPYEDCCTVFTPKHPRTRPTLDMLEAAEAALPVDELIEQAIQEIRRIHI